MIDRERLVRRHTPTLRTLDPQVALSVGNGEFAFTADVTGLQTFPELYQSRFPLCTMSHWGWHTIPPPSDLDTTAIRTTPYDTYGRPVGYVTDATGQETLFHWLRQNPHRLHLGRIGLVLRAPDGSPATPDDLTDITQTLDLWTGALHSRFTVFGTPVEVRTACHPTQDLVAVRIVSPLIAAERLGVRIAFPYGSPDMHAADWENPDRHTTSIIRQNDRTTKLRRQLDDDQYSVSLGWSEGATFQREGAHQFTLQGRAGDTLELSCRFAPQASSEVLPTFAETVAASERHWQQFWSVGGMVDFSDCTDARAPELERRVILSLYNTAIHSAGSLPSAETGLLCNSWYGKFHLEMHWWHSVHFAYWNHLPLLEKSLTYYHRILPIAREIAERQGYAGVRWPKMVGPDGHDSPSPVGPLLIWQQPHPIYFAELCYRANPSRETLEAWREIVFHTADFMASYAVHEPGSGQYVLGPPLKSVSENTEARATRNPAFELSYWRFGLRIASEWCQRLGLSPEERWEAVRHNLAPVPVADDVYLLQEGMDDTYTRWNWEHPAMLGAFGLLPGDGADAETMRRTVNRALSCWQWEKKSWGWDFPMAAMAAARSGEPELAVDTLLLDVPNNRYGPHGHVWQRANLPAYLPANGGLLTAVGMMAAGWTDAPPRPAPGFPDSPAWRVRVESITPLI
jgi:hypothetical protein